jgi:hypothetical protein
MTEAIVAIQCEPLSIVPVVMTVILIVINTIIPIVVVYIVTRWPCLRKSGHPLLVKFETVSPRPQEDRRS